MIDWLWLIVAFVLGYGLGLRRRADDIPKQLEHLEETVKREEQDLAYYKKLCRTLADENAEYRRNQNATKTK